MRNEDMKKNWISVQKKLQPDVVYNLMSWVEHFFRHAILCGTPFSRVSRRRQLQLLLLLLTLWVPCRRCAGRRSGWKIILKTRWSEVMYFFLAGWRLLLVSSLRWWWWWWRWWWYWAPDLLLPVKGGMITKPNEQLVKECRLPIRD